MKRGPVVWDWPLRLWHWAFAGFIVFSLYSGLDGDIGLLEWHQRSGLVLLGLLVFRVGWGLWGGRYARFGHYWTTPSAFVDHFRRRGERAAHTSPGIALAVVFLIAVAVQVGSGMFATDDIFNEGPLNRYVSPEFRANGDLDPPPCVLADPRRGGHSPIRPRGVRIRASRSHASRDVHGEKASGCAAIAALLAARDVDRSSGDRRRVRRDLRRPYLLDLERMRAPWARLRMLAHSLRVAKNLAQLLNCKEDGFSRTLVRLAARARLAKQGAPTVWRGESQPRRPSLLHRIFVQWHVQHLGNVGGRLPIELCRL